jgi:DNA helicase-2/ATP-dependent DNA helicase PcrA
VAYLVRERDIAPWRICAVTFTNKAAREMRDRLDTLVGDAAGKLVTGTFHALCARFLRQHGQELGISRGFTIFDDDDQITLVRQALKALDLDPKQVTPRSMLVGISAAKCSGLSPQQYARGVENYREELVARVYARYQGLLDHNQGLDFDDLLLRTVDLLDLPNGVAARQLPDRFRHVLVDEYQDTNTVQFELVRRLCATHGNIYVVGDPDQSIYAFRGATIRNILEYETAFPNAVVIRLEQNYRSTQAILRAADLVIADNAERHEKRLWTSNPEGEPVTIHEFYDEHHEAQWVVQQMQRLIDREGYRPRHIAVLYRTNAQSQPVEHMLRRQMIAYQLIGGTRFYERREIKDVFALLRLIVNPDDDLSLRRVVDAMPIGKGLGAKTWLQLEAWATAAGLSIGAALANLTGAIIEPAPPLTGRSLAAARNLGGLLADLRQHHGRLDLVALFDKALAESGYAAFLREGTEPERLENVATLRSELNRYLNLPIDAQLIVFLEEAALVAAVDELDADERDKVTLITLHAAKGLEFPVVFVIGMEDGLLPHVRSLTNERELEEERRLAFVGLTRARERLYLTHAAQRTSFQGTNPQTRSQFLDAIDPPTVRTRPRTGASAAAGAGRSTWHAMSPTTTQRGPQRPPARLPDESVEPEFVVAITAGDRVRHAVFGVGTVRSVTPVRNDVEVMVDFGGERGTKKLMASLANLSRA